MPPATSANFRAWLKGSSQMKLSSDAAVTRTTYECISTFPSLIDFDKKSVEFLSRIYKEITPTITEDTPAGIESELQVPGAKISSIAVRRLIVAVDAIKYYTSTGRTMTPANMHYSSLLPKCKIEHELYAYLKN